MMLFVLCLSRTSGRRAARAAGRLDGAYWLIGPGSAGLAQGCRCALPLQAWAGGISWQPPACSLLKLCIFNDTVNVFEHVSLSYIL